MSLSITTIFSSLPSAPHYWLALSGGLDSIALLHSFKIYAAEKKLNFTAVHIHHGWSARADEWEVFCEKLCNEWGIAFQSHRINAVVSTGESREAIAREKRYAVLGALLAESDCLLTAHHQNDQAETVLLQLFRGAGVKGLAAIPQVQSFYQGILYRPFLSCTRDDLVAYVQQHNLSWVEDESNADVSLKRNFIRHKLLPDIQQEWPGIHMTLSRSARLCAEADELLAEIAAADLKLVIRAMPLPWPYNEKNNDCVYTLSISKLRQLSAMRQRNVIRYWLLQLGFCLPSERKLLQLQQDVLNAKMDAMPVIKWQGTEVRKYRDDLYVMLPLDKTFDPKTKFRWDLRETLDIPQLNKILSAQKVEHSENNISQQSVYFLQLSSLFWDPTCCQPEHSQARDSGSPSAAIPQLAFNSKNEDSIKFSLLSITDPPIVEVRFRQGGEKMMLENRQGHHSLKKLFQEWSVPPWQRDRIPLIYINNQLVCVLGYAVSAEFDVKIKASEFLKLFA